jgi:hypothetical protein
MSRVSEEKREKRNAALREWRRWRHARDQRVRDRAIWNLWLLCDDEVVAACKKLAGRLSASLT